MILTALALALPLLASAQKAGKSAARAYPSPPPLPGNGLAGHDFFYTGENTGKGADIQTLSLVRGGKVVFTYTMPTVDASGNQGEFSDATMLSNGDIVIAYKTGWRKISPEGKTLYDYQCPKGPLGWHECHTVQPIGNDRVFYIQNGNPDPEARIYNIATDTIEMRHTLDVKQPIRSIHLQFRNCRLLKNGHYLIAHMDLGKIIEYDRDWKPVWQTDCSAAWHATRLKNGNTLINGNTYPGVREIAPDGKTVVWELRDGDLPGFRINSVHQAQRLSNGNTVITNWTNGVAIADRPRIVQLIEVTPDKKVVWAINQWADPNLGPASCIQILGEPGFAEDCDLMR